MCWAAWQREFAETGASGMEINVFLSIARYQEPAGGGLYKAYRSRKEISLETGYTELQVKNAVRRLTRRGCLKPIGKAHRGGSAQIYLLMPRCPLETDRKGRSPDAPNGEKRGAPQTPKGRSPDAPNINKNGDPAHRGSPGRVQGSGEAMLREAMMQERKARNGGR